MKKKSSMNSKELESSKDIEYLCKCDCGNFITVSGTDLKSGKVWACQKCMLEKKK